MNFTLKGAVLGFALVLASPAFADDVTAPAPAEAAAHVTWVADFDKAVAQAKAEKKDLFVDFTGSDWCIWCKRLHGEVFEKDDFLAAAKKDYILVALDYDGHGKAKSTNPNPARDDELKQKYASMIGGFPTVLLMNVDGEVFAKTGYKAGGTAQYVEHIAKLRADGLPALTSAKAIVAELAAAKDDEKSAVYAKAITALEALDEDSATAPMLAGPVKAAFDSDADNKSGVRLKAAKALLKSGSADEGVLAGATTLDPKNELGLLEFVVLSKCSHVRSAEAAKSAFGEIDALFAAGGPKDKAVKKQLAIQGMSFAGHPQVMNDKAKAKEYALVVKEIGFDADEDRLKEYIEKLLAEEPKDPK